MAAGTGQAAALGTALFWTGSGELRAAALLLGGLIVWAMLEAGNAPMDRKQPAAVGPRLLTIAQAAVTFATLWIALATARETSWILLTVGLAAVGTGVALRIVAIRTLGSLFLDDVGRNKHHPRVTHGIYARIRHPALGGLLVLASGAALCTNSIYAAGVVTVGLLPIAIARIRLEERLFAQHPVEGPVNGL